MRSNILQFDTNKRPVMMGNRVLALGVACLLMAAACSSAMTDDATVDSTGGAAAESTAATSTAAESSTAENAAENAAADTDESTPDALADTSANGSDVDGQASPDAGDNSTADDAGPAAGQDATADGTDPGASPKGGNGLLLNIEADQRVVVGQPVVLPLVLSVDPALTGWDEATFEVTGVDGESPGNAGSTVDVALDLSAMQPGDVRRGEVTVSMPAGSVDDPTIRVLSLVFAVDGAASGRWFHRQDVALVADDTEVWVAPGSIERLVGVRLDELLAEGRIDQAAYDRGVEQGVDAPADPADS